MRRRDLIKSAVVMPALGHLPMVQTVRAALTIDGDIYAHMIVAACASDGAAERYRKDWIGRPFEGQGEWYVLSTDPVDLPADLADLDATLTHHHTVVGVAAAEGEYLVAAIRRDFIAVIVRINGNEQNLMFDIVRHIAEQEVPSQFAVAWNDILLRTFFPTEESIGLPVEIGDDDSFWMRDSVREQMA